jgi:4-alpha-glucanotransferase
VARRFAGGYIEDVAASSQGLVAEALGALGIERLLLTVHDASFPGQPDEDLGRGSPYSRGAAGLITFAHGLGFNGLQLGPQGKTSRINASPFDGTLFGRSTLSAALGRLAAAADPRWNGLLPVEVLRPLVEGRPAASAARVDQRYVWDASEVGLRAAFAALAAQGAARPALVAELRAFVTAQRGWLAADSRFEALARRHGSDDWRRWPQPEGDVDPGEVAYADFCQFVVHTQHVDLRAELARLGMKLFGDLQIGVSLRDLWRWRGLFLGDYLMGAPPSRTNPDGQPWGYPVLDPDQYAGGGAADGLAFFGARLDKMLGEFDGLRIDHPHGLVCPWVYRAADPDPLRAVQTGARLFDSPDLPDHPALARFAIARPDQLAPEPGFPRHADDWVRALDPEQVARYAVLFDVLLATARRHGRDDRDIAAEVLSTCPFPLQAVLARHGLGRFRVTQKADPSDRRDPYRTDEAVPGDWVMVGTHDTPPIWRVLEGWTHARVAAWAGYLADRLEPQAAARPAFAAGLAREPRRLAAALFADLFVGPAARVSVFFADLFGMKDVYNAPGTVDPANWTLRVPPDYQHLYAERRARGEALDVPAALAAALRARARGAHGEMSDLAAALAQRMA